MQEVNLRFGDDDHLGAVVKSIMPLLAAEEHPHLVELTIEHVLQPAYRYGDEFDFGLRLIFDGLERSTEDIAAHS
jgi:hypothetical protein